MEIKDLVFYHSLIREYYRKRKFWYYFGQALSFAVIILSTVSYFHIDNNADIYKDNLSLQCIRKISFGILVIFTLVLMYCVALELIIDRQESRLMNVFNKAVNERKEIEDILGPEGNKDLQSIFGFMIGLKAEYMRVV